MPCLLNVSILQRVFQWEMDEYKKEGVKGKDIKFTDNRPLIDMFLEVCQKTLNFLIYGYLFLHTKMIVNKGWLSDIQH